MNHLGYLYFFKQQVLALTLSTSLEYQQMSKVEPLDAPAAASETQEEEGDPYLSRPGPRAADEKSRRLKGETAAAVHARTSTSAMTICYCALVVCQASPIPHSTSAVPAEMV